MEIFVKEVFDSEIFHLIGWKKASMILSFILLSKKIFWHLNVQNYGRKYTWYFHSFCLINSSGIVQNVLLFFIHATNFPFFTFKIRLCMSNLGDYNCVSKAFSICTECSAVLNVLNSLYFLLNSLQLYWNPLICTKFFTIVLNSLHLYWIYIYILFQYLLRQKIHTMFYI